MGQSENQTVPTDVKVTDFLAQLEDEQQRQDSEVLIQMMQRITGQPPVMWGPSIIGFGSHHYTYESGREGDEPELGFSPRKGKLSLYIVSDMQKYADQLSKLGKHKTSKVCIYVTRLSDIDMAVLEQLARTAYADLKKG